MRYEGTFEYPCGVFPGNGERLFIAGPLCFNLFFTPVAVFNQSGARTQRVRITFSQLFALLSATSCFDIFVSTHREMLRVVYQILLFNSEDESRYRTFSFLLMLP